MSSKERVEIVSVRRRPVRWIASAIVLGCAVLAVVYALCWETRAKREEVPLSMCPLTLSYISASEGCTFSASRTTRTPLSLQPGWLVRRFFGRTECSKGWVCLLAKDDPGTTDNRRVAVISDTRARTILDSGDDGFLGASLWKDRIIVPCVVESKPIIIVYDLAGRKVMRVPLLVGDRRVRHIGHVDVSDAGLMVCDIRFLGSDVPEIYLFERTGRLIRHLGSGAAPVITGDGRRIAFVNGRYTAVVADWRERTATTFEAWRPRHILDSCSLFSDRHADTLAELRWSPDSRWLLCGLRRSFSRIGMLVVAVDTRSSSPKRCYLPMLVEGGRWVVACDTDAPH